LNQSDRPSRYGMAQRKTILPTDENE